MHLMRRHAGKAGNFLAQQVAEAGALADDAFESFQLRRGHRGLRLAHAVIRRERLEQTAGEPVESFVAALLEQRAEPGIIRGDQTAVAAGDVLRVLQRKAGDVADRADGLAAIFCAPGLRGVLDQHQAVFVRERLQCLQIARVAAEMHGDDGLRLRREIAEEARAD